MNQLEGFNISPVTGHVLESVRRFPDNPALELNDRIYTYRELYEAASEISRAIIDKKDPNPFVALVADKSFTCYAGILGILMTGKAYMPLNPKFPLSRNLYMLEKAGVKNIIPGENSTEQLNNILKSSNQKSPLNHGVVSENAYLLFTSGTTGQPKGVPVSHANLGAYLDFMLSTYEFSPDDRFTQIFDLTFDLSVHDIFLAWSSGACLVVPDDNSSFAMSRFIKEKRPTVWFSVPSIVNLMDKMRLLKQGSYPSIRLSFFCGEALHVKTATAWKEAVPESRMINLYGPTEATIAITGYELPIENRESRIENRQLKSELGIVSIGNIFEGNSFIINKENTSDDHGELCLNGKQVVEGYLDNYQADQEAFFSDPATGHKFYRTGDIVRTDAEGDLFYLGRKDSEVKILGYRVNLKEIESVIEGYENVRQAVVIYDQPDKNAEMIIAFLLAEFIDEKITGKDLDDHCRSKLPWYMVPGKFIFVNDIPLNANGKVDKAALKVKYGYGK